MKDFESSYLVKMFPLTRVTVGAILRLKGQWPKGQARVSSGQWRQCIIYLRKYWALCISTEFGCKRSRNDGDTQQHTFIKPPQITNWYTARFLGTYDMFLGLAVRQRDYFCGPIALITLSFTGRLFSSATNSFVVILFLSSSVPLECAAEPKHADYSFYILNLSDSTVLFMFVLLTRDVAMRLGTDPWFGRWPSRWRERRRCGYCELAPSARRACSAVADTASSTSPADQPRTPSLCSSVTAYDTCDTCRGKPRWQPVYVQLSYITNYRFVRITSFYLCLVYSLVYFAFC